MRQVNLSVVILNYRRRSELVRVIDSVLSQSVPADEVIVVDNASQDGTAEYVAECYPAVRVLPLSENFGCGGRNHGVRAASGDIVVMLDNDVALDSPFELQKVVSTMTRLPDASCIVFKILRADNGELHVRDWCHPRSYLEFADQEFETTFIAEGACAFRRDAFLKVGGYFEPFWIGCEGDDLALGIFENGGTIYYTPEIRVRHSMSHETRVSGRNYYTYTRNSIWIAFRNYRGLARWKYLTYQIGMFGVFSLREGHPEKFLSGFFEGFKRLKAIPRRPVSTRTQSRIRDIMAFRPGLRGRLMKHWAKPQI